jgi:hypothetical protein
LIVRNLVAPRQNTSLVQPNVAHYAQGFLADSHDLGGNMGRQHFREFVQAFPGLTAQPLPLGPTVLVLVPLGKTVAASISQT